MGEDKNIIEMTWVSQLCQLFYIMKNNLLKFKIKIFNYSWGKSYQLPKRIYLRARACPHLKIFDFYRYYCVARPPTRASLTSRAFSKVIASTIKMLQGSVGLSLLKKLLITLDVSVDPPYKQIGAQVTNRPCKVQIALTGRKRKQKHDDIP